MSDKEASTVITLTGEDMEQEYHRLMDGLPYETPGQLRDAVFNGGNQCCSGCIDYSHPHADRWSLMVSWLFLSGKDWRTVE